MIALRPAATQVNRQPDLTGFSRFMLYRVDDATGVSGEGYVANGIVFPDGTATMRWCCPRVAATTVAFDHWRDVEAIHGHGGATMIVWIDPPPPNTPRHGPHARPTAVLPVRQEAA